MRRRLGIWGASEESLRLLRLLSGNPDVEVLRIFDESVASALEQARAIGTALAHHVAPLLLDDEERRGAGGAAGCGGRGRQGR